MLSKLQRYWSDAKFDALIKHRIEKAREMLSKHGMPAAEEVAAVSRAFAEAIVRRNLGKIDLSEVERLQQRVCEAARYMETLFQQDGHSAEFSRALSYVCVVWDLDTYERRAGQHNLTLNYLLKKHTIYGRFFTEKKLVKGT